MHCCTSTAYAPWRQVVRILLGLTQSDATSQGGPAASTREAERVQAFVSETKPDWSLRLPLLGDLLGVPIPDNPTTAAFEPQLRQRALFDLVAEMVQRVAQVQPLLLLLDDAHWMDAASQELTLVVGRVISESAILLSLVHRPSLTDVPLLPELETSPYYHRVVLDSLSPEGVAALVADRLGGETERLAVALIQGEAEGNPFIVEEVVDALRESGHLYCREDGCWDVSEQVMQALRQAACLVRQDGEWVLAPDASLSAVDIGLPDSIHGIVLSRIDRLAERPKLTLKVASVIGLTFGLDLLTDIHPASREGGWLMGQISVLETRDFVRPKAPLPRPSYRFKHNVTHDVVYETLLFEQRRGLHRAVGEALEREWPDEAAALAYHTFLGEDWARALCHQMAAGQRAQRLFANYEAIDHFKKALHAARYLSSAETLARRREIHTILGELLINTSQYETALGHLHEALALSVNLEDHDMQSTVCRWIARVHENRGEYGLAVEWIERGLELLGDQETVVKAELLAIAGLIHTRQGNYEQAEQAAENGIRIATLLGDSRALAFTYMCRGNVFLTQGNSLDAIKDFQAALDLYKAVEDIYGQAKSYNMIASAFFNLSQWQDADRHYRQARNIFYITGAVYNVAMAENNLAELARYQGRLDDALRSYHDSSRLLEQIGAPVYLVGVVHMNLGATFAMCGQSSAARLHLKLSKDYFDRAGTRDFLPELHRHSAEAALRNGELFEADSEAQLSLSLSRDLGMRVEEGISLRIYGEVAVAKRDASLAERRLTESMAILKGCGDDYELARTELSLAKVYLLLGKQAQGARALEHCISVFGRLNAALHLAEAQTLREGLST